MKASFSAQLQAAGLPHWAVYLAVCSSSQFSQAQQPPDLPASDPPAQPATDPQVDSAQQHTDSQVQELLKASAPSWAADKAVQDFLRQRLHTPAAWLAAALALWALRSLDALGEAHGL